MDEDGLETGAETAILVALLAVVGVGPEGTVGEECELWEGVEAMEEGWAPSPRRPLLTTETQDMSDEGD